MTSFLLAALLLMQTAAARPDTGVVTGLVRKPGGEPASGVRVAALVASEPGADAGSTDLLSIAQTGPAGEYRLEDIPPGRYFIISGRMALPTYFPGTTSIVNATPVVVTAGATIAGVDFSMSPETVQAFSEYTYRQALREPPAQFPGKILTDGGAAADVFGSLVVARRVSDGITFDGLVRADGTFQISLPSGEYRMTLMLLPLGYSVRTMVSGSVDLLTGNLQNAQLPGTTGPAIDITLTKSRPTSR